MCLLSKITCVHEIKAYTKEELIKITKRRLIKEKLVKQNLIKRNKTLNPFLIKQILLGIPAIVTEILPSPVSHSAQVRAVFKEIVVDMVMLDDLPDVGIYGKGFHFLEGEKKNAVSDFFPYAANPHEAFPGVPVFQAEKDVKIQLSRSHFSGCFFYAFGSEAQLAFVKHGNVSICKGFRVGKTEISFFEFLSEKLAEKADPFLDCGDA